MQGYTDDYLYSNTVEKGSVDIIEHRIIRLHRPHQPRQLLRHQECKSQLVPESRHMASVTWLLHRRTNSQHLSKEEDPQ